jgi:DNA uptake protein ComE-like DNA-binding protein
MRNLSRVTIISLFILVGTAGTFSVNFIFATEKIDVNTASLEDLIKIIHIGETRALELISLRPFSSLDDLARIKGIGEKRVEDIKKQGLAWAETTESEPRDEAETSSELLTKGEAKIAYSLDIIISELLPSPEGPDETEEWIELFNQNSFEVELSGWKIEDAAGRTTTYTFSQETKIEPLGFLVLFRPTSKITLNNDADSLSLFQPNDNIVDSVSYEKAPRGQSYNRTPADWAWSTILTPGLANVVLLQEAKETEFFEEKGENKEGKVDINVSPLKELEKLTGIGPVLAQRIIDSRPFYSLDDLARVKGIGPKILEDIKNQELAWISPELEPPKIEKTEPFETEMAAIAIPFRQGYLDKEILKSLSSFLIALALAIFSGVTILTLKKKLKTLS